MREKGGGGGGVNAIIAHFGRLVAYTLQKLRVVTDDDDAAFKFCQRV